jgi:hypothetical protein
MTTPYVNPIGAGLHSARIDMGVDYTGAGPLYALGSGTIVNVSNAGWPGGKFISLKLDQGPYAGKYVFYAENIIARVKVGQHVTAGQLIGTAVGKYPYIEVGWAAPPGTGQTMAAALGQQSKSGDPGKFSTAFGVSMSNFIKSLGGPGGILTPGGVRGTVPAGYPDGGIQTASSVTSGNLLQGCVPLVWVVWYAVCQAKKFRWNLSRHQPGNRRGSYEGRNERRCRRSIAIASRARTRLDTNRRSAQADDAA